MPRRKRHSRRWFGPSATRAPARTFFRALMRVGALPRGRVKALAPAAPKIARAASQPHGNIPRGVSRQVFRLRVFRNPPSRDSTGVGRQSQWPAFISRRKQRPWVEASPVTAARPRWNWLSPERPSRTTLPSLPLCERTRAPKTQAAYRAGWLCQVSDESESRQHTKHRTYFAEIPCFASSLKK